jgi:hypothetical protein
LSSKLTTGLRVFESMAGAADEISVPSNSGLSAGSMGAPATADFGPGLVWVLGERHELQLAGIADECPDLVAVADPGDLDHDPVAALGLDDRFGEARGVDAVLDDRADGVHHVGRDRPVDLGDRLVLAAKPALKVEAELGLDHLTVAERPRDAQRQVDREGSKAYGHDDEGKEASHRRRLYQGHRKRRRGSTARGG